MKTPKTPQVVVCDNPEPACELLAGNLADFINNRSRHGQHTVFGIVGGHSPRPLFTELIRLHKAGTLSFQNVTIIVTYEFLGLDPENEKSISARLKRGFLNHIDIPPEQIHFPRGTLPSDQISAHCEAFENHIARAGGIDIQILGIGRTGHIAYNEPGTPADSRTQPVLLNPVTRFDAAPDFGGIDNVPSAAITLGCGTILEAKHIALLAWGMKKAPVVRQAIEGPVTPDVSASLLRNHPSTTVYLDLESASCLEPSPTGGNT